MECKDELRDANQYQYPAQQNSRDGSGNESVNDEEQAADRDQRAHEYVLR